MTPGRTSLEAIIAGCGIALDRAQLDQLWAYHRMLRSANAELNLTRIHNFENMVLKHYVDSLLVLRFVELPSPLIDMGSGPGLPGVPLKIARPGVSMILAEPRGARAEFLEQVCERLKLADVEVFAGKVGSKFPKQVRGVITRAVASIPETLDRVANCLEVGGRMIFMKGPDCDAEIAEARTSHAETFRLVLDKAYTIPGTTHDRRLVVYERLEGEGGRHEHCDLGLCRDGSRSGERVEPNLQAGPRPPDRQGDSQARPGADRGRPGGRRGPRPVPGPGRRVADRHQREPASRFRGPSPLVPAGRSTVPEPRCLGDSIPPAPGPGARDSGVVPFGRLAGRLHAVRPVPGPRERRGGDPLGRGVRRVEGRAPPRVGPPVPPQGGPRRPAPALFQVALEHGPSIRDLESAEVPLLALSAEGPEIGSEPFPDRFGLVAGLEGPGLPDHLRTGPTRRIPMQPGVESLNAATATAVALYAWRQSLSQRPVGKTNPTRWLRFGFSALIESPGSSSSPRAPGLTSGYDRGSRWNGRSRGPGRCTQRSRSR